MRILSVLLVLALLGVIAVQGIVRLTPLDADRLHRTPAMPGEGDGSWTNARGFRASVALDMSAEAVLDRLDAVILSTPRTWRLAGSVTEARVTYVTRTAFWGFPDITVIEATPEGAGTRLRIKGVTLFAGYDWDVNAARVTGWLTTAEIPVPPARDESL